MFSNTPVKCDVYESYNMHYTIRLPVVNRSSRFVDSNVSANVISNRLSHWVLDRLERCDTKFLTSTLSSYYTDYSSATDSDG